MNLAKAPEAYSLGDRGYERVEESKILPTLDLALLAQYVTAPDPLDAALSFREAIGKM